ncbi:response regulator transcription factor [Saxibacter everestensis]|uniref:Response regulator transcription factor n=1 Tax=Saxibacter everestensis TaxID=2909229 RepID=A0ABY8QSI6_9MICO|nr:response regulator transcription factor [Brevibacteriaceae bacterium ZFBP1038]
MIRVLICDDHPIVRAGLRALLAAEDDIEVVGEAESAETAVIAAREIPAELVLMDLQFGGEMHGAEATRQIRSQTESAESGHSAPYVLVLTNYETDADILGAVEAGASGYLLKDAPPDELLAAIRLAAAGQTALAPKITARLMNRVRSPRANLSQRELEVLGHVAEGQTNAEIARALFLSETTVKSHLVHIFTKLDVATRTSAVSKARRLGLIRSS